MTYHIDSDKISYTQLGDEGVLFAIETNEYSALSATFLQILQGVARGQGPAEIVTALCQEYDIAPEACRREVDAALDELLTRGFIVPATPAR